MCPHLSVPFSCVTCHCSGVRRFRASSLLTAVVIFLIARNVCRRILITGIGISQESENSEMWTTRATILRFPSFGFPTSRVQNAHTHAYRPTSPHWTGVNRAPSRKARFVARSTESTSIGAPVTFQKYSCSKKIHCQR